MLFVPEHVHNMANTLEPAVEATQHHARRIAGVGFEPGHAGRDYQPEGARLVAGVGNVIAMFQSWSEASGATVGALRHAVSTTVGVDDDSGAQIRLTGSLGQS